MIRSAIPSKGEFAKEAFGADPELADIFDRYLSGASWEQTGTGFAVYVPTSFQARGLQRFQIRLEKALNGPVTSIQTRRPEFRPEPGAPSGLNSGPNESSSQPTRRGVLTPLSPNAEVGWSSSSGNGPNAAARQYSLNLPPRLAQVDPRKAEQTRRLPAPSFSLSPSNEMSLLMLKNWALALNAENTARATQVVWIYGAAGSGKSHLLKQLNSWVTLDKRLESTTVMGFFSQWRESLDKHDPLPFKRKYRHEADLFVLENIDDLQGKTKTQEEVLHTVSALLERGAFIAVSSTLHPLQMKEILEPALFSRLFSGLSIETAKPDRAFREVMWRKMLETHGLSHAALELAVQERLLNLSVDTARKANTLFVNAIGRLSLRGQLTFQDVLELEGNFGERSFVPTSQTQHNPRELAEAVARISGSTLTAIQGKVRRQDICLARRFVFLALSRFLGLTNGTIAQILEKDASTVSYGIKTILEDVQTNRRILEQWNYICAQLGMPPTLPQS